MNDRPTASTITDAQLDALYDELAALRQVARGYCPACGRGDAAPTVADWEQQRQRADQAEELLRIAHDTSNKSEAERARAVQRAGQLAAALREVLDAFSTTVRDEPGGRVLGYLAEAPIHPDDMARWRAVLDQPKEQ